MEQELYIIEKNFEKNNVYGILIGTEQQAEKHRIYVDKILHAQLAQGYFEMELMQNENDERATRDYLKYETLIQSLKKELNSYRDTLEFVPNEGNE